MAIGDARIPRSVYQWFFGASIMALSGGMLSQIEGTSQAGTMAVGGFIGIAIVVAQYEQIIIPQIKGDE